MAAIFFIVCRLLAIIAVGGIITVLMGIAANKIEV
jgi:hypothetical protein